MEKVKKIYDNEYRIVDKLNQLFDELIRKYPMCEDFFTLGKLGATIGSCAFNMSARIKNESRHGKNSECEIESHYAYEFFSNGSWWSWRYKWKWVTRSAHVVIITAKDYNIAKNMATLTIEIGEDEDEDEHFYDCIKHL